MKAPIRYIPNFISNPDDMLLKLKGLNWERRSDAPRYEYYCNDYPLPYIYGVGRGRREYLPQVYSSEILEIRKKLEIETGFTYEVCFLNMYKDQSDQLGWHADDSPEMDDARPVVSISFGVEREIHFRSFKKNACCGSCGVERNENAAFEAHNHKMSCYVRDYFKPKFGEEIESIKLGNGSACIMDPGMQDNWQHRIPKASFQCGERISLTFRGYNLYIPIMEIMEA